MMLSRLSPYLAVLAVLGNTVNVCVARDEGPVRNYEEDLNDIATVVVRKFLPIFSEALTSPEVEPECSSALLKTFVGLQQQKAWALRSEYHLVRVVNQQARFESHINAFHESVAKQYSLCGGEGNELWLAFPQNEFCPRSPLSVLFPLLAKRKTKKV